MRAGDIQISLFREIAYHKAEFIGCFLKLGAYERLQHRREVDIDRCKHLSLLGVNLAEVDSHGQWHRRADSGENDFGRSLSLCDAEGQIAHLAGIDCNRVGSEFEVTELCKLLGGQLLYLIFKESKVFEAIVDFCYGLCHDSGRASVFRHLIYHIKYYSTSARFGIQLAGSLRHS